MNLQKEGPFELSFQGFVLWLASPVAFGEAALLGRSWGIGQTACPLYSLEAEEEEGAWSPFKIHFPVTLRLPLKPIS